MCGGGSMSPYSLALVRLVFHNDGLTMWCVLLGSLRAFEDVVRVYKQGE